MVITVERVSDNDARARMAEILGELRVTQDELEAKRDAYTLTAPERALGREYERLAYIVSE